MVEFIDMPSTPHAQLTVGLETVLQKLKTRVEPVTKQFELFWKDENQYLPRSEEFAPSFPPRLIRKLLENVVYFDDYSRPKSFARELKYYSSNYLLQINRMRLLQEVARTLPKEEKIKFLEVVKKREIVDPVTHRQNMLIDILTYPDPDQRHNGLLRRLNAVHIKPEELKGLVDNEFMLRFVSYLMQDPQKNRAQIGLLLSELQITSIPENIRGRLEPILSDLEFKVKAEHLGWFLCAAAEPRLKTALDEGLVTYVGPPVNPVLVVKHVGKKSALCLKDFQTPEGKVFVRGNWYSPINQELRQELDGAFDTGQLSIEHLEGEWALMREVEGKFKFYQHGRTTEGYVSMLGEDLLTMAQKRLLEIPNELNRPYYDPYDGKQVSRQEYREINKEDHFDVL